MHCPKVHWLIHDDWFHLFLNYLYLVALLDLKVSYAFMFCSLWRTSWKPFVCFSLWFEHTLTFIVSFSWSFVCVHLHVYNMVAKFIAVMIISSCPCFKFYWSQLTNAYIYDQDCVGACHLKNYFFCYHLPTRVRAGVKLADAWYVSNVSIIFYASCLFLHHLPTVSLHFVALLCIFWN